ncbi:MAG: GHKL domain-containing protein [Luteitalea sp.]|nr:GHKL domain-containing protein [Luteitalea sp.]
MTTPRTTIEELRRIAFFDDLPDHVLTWFVEHGELMTASAGERLFEPGGTPDRMVILLEGEFDVRGLMNGQMTTFFTAEQGTVGGLLPYSRMKAYTAEGIATKPSRLLAILKDLFPEMLALHPELSKRVVALLSDRIRETTRWVGQREKLMALGKLSSGLAHELNNPAAAVTRAASALKDRLRTLSEAASELAACELIHGHAETLEQMRQMVLQRHAAEGLSPVERGRQEDAIADWLEARGVEQPWVLAETYADAGVTASDLESGLSTLPAETLPEVLAWLEASLAADRLLGEIVAAAGRISELVASIKAYSHMDRAIERQLTDVREGLDNTLVMLGHQIKKKQVAIERAYAEDLPKVPGHPGELTQVWTNLLDNAIDALPQTGGRIRIEAEREHDGVEIRVIDNGSGIPEALQSRIFEPFYTTKAMGTGTGLGLDIVQRVVTLQHSGRVTVSSEPGHTVFTVSLPLEVGPVAEPAPHQPASNARQG